MKHIKKILWTVLILALGAGFYLFVNGNTLSGLFKDNLYIAVVGPMTGSNRIDGLEMLNGINLYLKKLNNEGGVNGRQILLQVYDDKNDKAEAVKAARRLSSEKKVLAVLGHYSNIPSIAAGKIYKKNAIAAVTASAPALSVTKENEWYFRVIPNSAFQGAFYANFVKKKLNREVASLIYIDDPYGNSLAETFVKTANRIGLDIRIYQGLHPRSQRLLNFQLEKLMNDAKTMEDPGLLFIATQGYKAAKIVSSLQDMGMDYTFMGDDELSASSFLEELSEYPQEEASPGYYSNGIYAASPMLFNIASDEVIRFRQEYLAEYQIEPSWVATTYYSAAQTIAEAIRNSDIRGKGHVRGDRKAVRASLEKFYNLENSVDSITGRLHFDKDGDVALPLDVGTYRNHELLPTYWQYRIMPEHKTVEGIFEKALSGEIISVAGNIMNEVRVVYSGVLVEKISNLDIKNSTCTIDFHVWFRYAGKFDDSDIEFVNATKPVQPGRLVYSMTTDDETVRVYKMTGEFKNEFRFDKHPFERLEIRMRFHHATLTRDRLIYVADQSGPPGFTEPPENPKLENTAGWKVTDKLIYQDIVKTISSVGNPKYFNSPQKINYSRLNAGVLIERSNPVYGYFRLVPLIIVAALAFIVLLLPAGKFELRMLILIAALILNAASHINLSTEIQVDYILAVEFGYFSGYGIMVILVFGLIFQYVRFNGKHEKEPGKARSD